MPSTSTSPAVPVLGGLEAGPRDAEALLGEEYSMLDRFKMIIHRMSPRGDSSESHRGDTDTLPVPAEPEYRVMFAFDIAKFGERKSYVQKALRSALYQIVEKTCTTHHIRWDRTYNEDRGDGLFFITDISVMPRLEDLAISIGIALRQYNRSAEPAHRFAVRMAIHVGHVQHDVHGVVGPDIILLHRLLDAPVLRKQLEDNPHASFALIISSAVYRLAGPRRMIVRRDYRRVLVQVKETSAKAWMLQPKAPTTTGAIVR